MKFIRNCTFKIMLMFCTFFQKVKGYVFHGCFAFFQYTNSTRIHNNINHVCIIISSWNLCHDKEER